MSCCCCSVAAPVGVNMTMNTNNTLSYSKIIAFDRNPKQGQAISIRSIQQSVFEGLRRVHQGSSSSFANGRNFNSCQPIFAVKPELDTSVTDMKDIGAILRKSNVVIESRDEDTIQVRVDLTGKDTQKVFDDVLTNLARTAPAIPGFRKTKGGKMSNVPRDFLIRAIGEARIVKFVIQEIVSTAMTEYVEEATLKVKKEFKTIQTPEELESQFEPGKPFVFNATLDIDKSEPETPSSELDV